MDLTNIGTIKKLCEECGVRPSRNMGQNFLVNPGVLEKIVGAGELSQGNTVLEIGPGFGVLTRELLPHVGGLLLVEKDKRLFEYLQKEIRNKKLEIRNMDVLKLDIGSSGFEDSGYKIISNLPYQISSPVLWKFLHEEDVKPSMVVLMLQKEVAERIVAKPGQMSLLSVLCQFYAKCEIVSVVKAGSFWPIPKVDSAIIKLSVRQQDVNNFKEDLFFKVVKVGFLNKRKMLKNNLVSGLKLSQGEIVGTLKQVGLNEKVRAQELSVVDWIGLVKRLNFV